MLAIVFGIHSNEKSGAVQIFYTSDRCAICPALCQSMGRAVNNNCHFDVFLWGVLSFEVKQ